MLPARPHITRIDSSLYSVMLQFRQAHISGPSWMPFGLCPAKLHWRWMSQHVFILFPQAGQKRMPLSSAASMIWVLSNDVSATEAFLHKHVLAKNSELLCNTTLRTVYTVYTCFFDVFPSPFVMVVLGIAYAISVAHSLDFFCPRSYCCCVVTTKYFMRSWKNYFAGWGTRSTKSTCTNHELFEA